MLNRRHIRIKVMQSLYAFSGSESEDLKREENFLLHSLDGVYDLYLSMFALLTALHKKGLDYNEKLKKKMLASDEDKNPSTKFVDNEVLIFISENKLLQERINKRKLNIWDLDFEYVDILFRKIIKSDIYKAYLKDPVTFKTDQKFVYNIYKSIIATDDKLYHYIEDKQITWIDDFPVVNTSILKLLKKLKRSAPETSLLPELYKDEDDKLFALNLLKKSILNYNSYKEEAAKKARNWDADRLASLDNVILIMALCEFQKFSSIPYKVTINEYLEIAKEYSTPKSSNFINGILDKISKEYKEKGIHPKIGRGLL